MENYWAQHGNNLDLSHSETYKTNLLQKYGASRIEDSFSEKNENDMPAAKKLIFSKPPRMSVGIRNTPQSTPKGKSTTSIAPRTPIAKSATVGIRSPSISPKLPATPIISRVSPKSPSSVKISPYKRKLGASPKTTNKSIRIESEDEEDSDNSSEDDDEEENNDDSDDSHDSHDSRDSHDSDDSDDSDDEGEDIEEYTARIHARITQLTKRLNQEFNRCEFEVETNPNQAGSVSINFSFKNQ